jgi:hypothetical protein
MPKKAKKKSTLEQLREKVRKAITLFNPGAAAIEGKVTPAIKKADKQAKKNIKGR